MRTYYTYVLANHSRRLYVGVTNNLVRRVYQHRAGRVGSYTTAFRIVRLVYYETCGDIIRAIAREKQLKRWPRERKLRLIERQNAGWRDLSIDWLPESKLHLEYDAPGEA